MTTASTTPPNAGGRVPYHFAYLRAVPHPYTGAFVNVGVALHARTVEFLGVRTIHDADTLRRLAPAVDVELLGRYLDCYERIARGDVDAGRVALLPPSERFHWMTAPRSDVLQPSPVHAGLTVDPAVTLLELFGEIGRA